MQCTEFYFVIFWFKKQTKLTFETFVEPNPLMYHEGSNDDRLGLCFMGTFHFILAKCHEEA